MHLICISFDFVKFAAIFKPNKALYFAGNMKSKFVKGSNK